MAYNSEEMKLGTPTLYERIEGGRIEQGRRKEGELKEEGELNWDAGLYFLDDFSLVLFNICRISLITNHLITSHPMI